MIINHFSKCSTLILENAVSLNFEILESFFSANSSKFYKSENMCFALSVCFPLFVTRNEHCAPIQYTMRRRFNFR